MFVYYNIVTVWHLMVVHMTALGKSPAKRNMERHAADLVAYTCILSYVLAEHMPWHILCKYIRSYIMSVYVYSYSMFTKLFVPLYIQH